MYSGIKNKSVATYYFACLDILAMTKLKKSFVCADCGSISNKWAGQCSDCGNWNSFTEVVAHAAGGNRSTHDIRSRHNYADYGAGYDAAGMRHDGQHAVRPEHFRGYAGMLDAQIFALSDVSVTEQVRISSGLAELDRVLGGGLVSGSVILLGGDPGIGKSTVLLQSLSYLSKNNRCLYVTGEESLQQVKLRAERLGLNGKVATDNELKELRLLAETNIETILELVRLEQPQIMVLDSIQTMYTSLVGSAPGSVSQLREGTAQLVQFAKATGTILFLVGHVTKEGMLAGPRVLEHMVDTVLYFEGSMDSRYRLLRAVKNRFGAVNEIGVFAMSDKGLLPVTNPSAIFLSGNDKAHAGSVVMATWEGSRPLLVEIQALVVESHIANPRRVVVGFDANRLALMLAVLSRHGGIVTFNQDVFINVVGGMRISETAVDLPALLAVLSSLRNRALPREMVVFGEVGLAGEIRPVQNGQERLKEALKLGFTQAIVPYANKSKQAIPGMQVNVVQHINEALQLV